MIGLLDWGIGGFGVLRALRREAPDLDIVYLSDAGATPYGKLDRDALRTRVERAILHLTRRGATHVVVACNAASTVVDSLDVAVPTTGMVPHAVRAMSESRGLVGVVGGARTIRSGIYRRALAREGVRVRQRIAQPLSAHIEAGTTDTADCEEALARITAPLRGASAVLLACTHYPAIESRFAAHLPGTRLVDPAAFVARHVATTVTTASNGRILALTTGDPSAARVAAERAFGVVIEAFEHTDV